MTTETSRPPLNAAADLRTATIGVRVSTAEYDAPPAKSEAVAMTLARWLREAALTRRLPAPPAAAINREQYAELARLAADLNQLTHLADADEHVSIATALLAELTDKVSRLRLEVVGAAAGSDFR